MSTAAPISPFASPRDVTGLLLVGGSFDPPTLAHIKVAEHAMAGTFGPCGWLVFVPAARSPFKPQPPEADAHRVAMLRLAAARLDRAAIWTDEIDRAKPDEPSYWIDTLRRARSLHPSATIRFLLGADQAVAFHRWRETHAILAIAEPVVVLRQPWTDRQRLIDHLGTLGVWSPQEMQLWRNAVLPGPLVEGSATSVRAALAADPPDDDTIAKLLDPAVAEYIRQHALYQSRTTRT